MNKKLEDFRLHYAAVTIDPEKSKKLTLKMQKQIAREQPIQSVRPGVPKDIQYVGTIYRDNNTCFDYYSCPDGSLRQEYRRKHQKIILAFKEKPEIPGRRNYAEDREAHHVLSSDYDGSLDGGKFSGCKQAQSDGQAVWGMEHDCYGIGDDTEIAANTGTGYGQRKGNFDMLPIGGEL